MSTRVTSGSAFEREGQSRGGSGPSGRPAGGKVDRAGRPVKRDASRQAARENAMFNWHTRDTAGVTAVRIYSYQRGSRTAERKRGNRETRGSKEKMSRRGRKAASREPSGEREGQPSAERR